MPPEQDASDDARPVENRVVRFQLPFPLRLTDSNGTAFQVVGPPPARVQVKFEQAPSSGGFAIGTGVGALEGGDPYGRMGFTRIAVVFSASADPDVLDWSDHELIEEAIAVANRLIEHYRDVANVASLRPIAARHIIDFTVFETPANKPRNLLQGSGPYHTGVDGSVEKAVAERLAAGAEVHFFRSLELDVEQKILFGQHREAVVEAGTLFEIWLKQALRSFLKDHGDGPEAIDAFFRVASNPNLFKSVTRLASRDIDELTGYSFKDAPEFDQWALDVRDLRNEIVHGTRRAVTAEEARAASTAVHAAVRVLREKTELH